MQLHKKVQSLLTYIGTCESSDDTRLYIKNCYKLVAISLSAIFFVVTLSYIYSAYIALRTGDVESLLCFIGDTGGFSYSTFLMITTFLARTKLKQLFLKVQENYDQCNAIQLYSFFDFILTLFSLSVKEDDCSKYLGRTDIKSQRIVKYLMDFFSLGFALSYFAAGVLTLTYNFYQDGYIDSEKFYYPYPLL